MTAPRRPQRASQRRVQRAATREPRASIFVPIAVKYAVATGVMLALFMVVLGYVSYRVAIDKMDHEINDKGIKLVLFAAHFIDPFWSDQSPDDAADTVELQQRLERFKNEAEGILEIIVYPPDKEMLITTASGSKSVALAGRSPMADTAARDVGVKINTGSIDREKARSYECPIIRDKVTKGIVEVFLSAKVVQETREELQYTSILWTLGATVVGIVAAILIGGYLTRPIRILRRDMMAVTAGDLQHQARVTTGDELGLLASSFNRMTQHLAEAREQESSRKALERELSIATTIQESLLPDRIPAIKGYDLFPHYESAREVGGDYYDFLDLGMGRCGIVVADVSGKGIPGSLVMTMTRSLIRMAARESSDPATILARVNNSLSQDMTRGMFVTLILADLDSSTGRLRIARAGHNPAFLYQARRAQLVALQPDGIALGMDKGDLFATTLQVQEYSMEPGDVLVLYTDGIVEAMDPDGNEYTSARFAQLLSELHGASCREIVSAVVKDVEQHAAGADPSDDITLIVLKRED